MNQDKYNAAKGCLLGALVGDAAGATLEFFETDITSNDVARAMGMPGGGDLDTFGVGLRDGDRGNSSRWRRYRY